MRSALSSLNMASGSNEFGPILRIRHQRIRHYQAAPLVRIPGEAGAADRLECRTYWPLAVPSGERFIDTPSLEASALPYTTTWFEPSVAPSTTVSPVLLRLRAPLDAAKALPSPAGIADAPPNTTSALPGARVVAAAKVWRGVAAADSG